MTVDPVAGTLGAHAGEAAQVTPYSNVGFTISPRSCASPPSFS